jgi:CheY-like chemotaxis protein
MRILIVDDSRLVLAIAAGLLDGCCEVLTATSGDEAIAKAAAERPHAVLTDFNMPGRNGLETARALRENAQTRDIPVAIMTTDSELTRVPAEFSTLLKPFDSSSLLRTLAALVRPDAVRTAA